MAHLHRSIPRRDLGLGGTEDQSAGPRYAANLVRATATSARGQFQETRRCEYVQVLRLMETFVFEEVTRGLFQSHPRRNRTPIPI